MCAAVDNTSTLVSEHVPIEVIEVEPNEQSQKDSGQYQQVTS